ncbi:MAG: YaiO family outer membrane beta-barrel protein [Telluria sp.]
MKQIAMLIACLAPCAVLAGLQPESGAADAHNSYGAAYGQARALAQSGQSEAAAAAYTALLVRHPDHVDVLLGRAQAYVALGRWEAADHDLRKAVALAPDYADLWLALGGLAMRVGQPVEAIKAYSHLLALRGADGNAYLARARAYRASGEEAAARIDAELARVNGAPAQSVDAFLTAQSAPQKWSVSMASTHTNYHSGRGDWQDDVLSWRRQLPGGSATVEVLRSQRFGLSDHAFALDAYADLRPGTYVNLRYQQAPQAILFPRKAWRAELSQALGSGWELAASGDSLGFDGAPARLAAVALAKYIGRFYIQVRHQRVVAAARGANERVLLRYYYGGDDANFLQISATSGTVDEALARANVSGARQGVEIGLSVLHYFGRQWGVRAEAGYGRERAGHSKSVLGGALAARW